MEVTRSECCQTADVNLNFESVHIRQERTNVTATVEETDFNLNGSDANTATSCSCFPWNDTSGRNDGVNTTAGHDVVSMSPPEYVYAYVTMAAALIFVAGVLGNLLVIYVVVRLRSMRTRMNLYLVSLSVADLMVLMICPPVALMDLFGKERWFLGAFMCKLIPYLENTAVHSSALCLLAISQERYVAICRPLSVVGRRHTGLPTICLTWLLSLLPCLPFIFISELNQVPYYDGTYQPMCQTKTSLRIVKVFMVMDFVLCMLLPLVAITFFYTSILWTVASIRCCCCGSRGDTLPAQSCTAGGDPESYPRTRAKVVKMMVTVVAFFYACLLPMRSLTIWAIFVSPDSLARLGFEGYLNLLNVARLLMFVNSAVNPIIYGLMSSKFSNAFVRALPFPCVKRLSASGGPNSSPQSRTARTDRTCGREAYTMVGMSGAGDEAKV
ncbi:QRFP-like peptide receptor [Babylonia areolata]|uniref:QRFP-like peptide receptor n=1 Tax=Babylonia areolata TaxID=304850 RepID=UPI003FD37781